MSDTLTQVVAFAAGRYNALVDGPQPNPAWAFLAIINAAKDFPDTSLDPERELLDWLRQPHSNPALLQACQEVLGQIGQVGGR